MLAKLLPLIPCGGRPYCEPFCGAASVFFARDPAPIEVLNDIDSEIVNLFRVLQNPETLDRFRRIITSTPYARAELGRAIEIWRTGIDDPIWKAWSFFVRCNMGFSGVPAKHVGTWSRAFTSASGISKSTSDWLMRLTMIDACHWRLERARIHNRDAIDVIKCWDNPNAVFYIDPPYVLETRKRSARDVYHKEMSRGEHNELTHLLLKCVGAVVLSGYRDQEVHTPLEDAGWIRIDFETACHAPHAMHVSKLQDHRNIIKREKRTESVWINQRAISMLPPETQEHIKELKAENRCETLL